MKRQHPHRLCQTILRTTTARSAAASLPVHANEYTTEIQCDPDSVQPWLLTRKKRGSLALAARLSPDAVTKPARSSERCRTNSSSDAGFIQGAGEFLLASRAAATCVPPPSRTDDPSGTAIPPASYPPGQQCLVSDPLATTCLPGLAPPNHAGNALLRAHPFRALLPWQEQVHDASGSWPTYEHKITGCRAGSSSGQRPARGFLPRTSHVVRIV